MQRTRTTTGLLRTTQAHALTSVLGGGLMVSIRRRHHCERLWRWPFETCWEGQSVVEAPL